MTDQNRRHNVDATLAPLNVALHGATVRGLQLDRDRRRVTVSFTPVSLPKSGSPVGPLDLVLSDVSRLVVAIQTPDGDAPPRGMTPVSIDRVNDLVQDNHPLAGYDFIDSTRDAAPRGQVVADWTKLGPGSTHVLSFFYGLQSAEGVAALLFFRIFFETAELRRQDGREYAIDNFGSGERLFAVASEEDDAIARALPDPVDPASIARASLALFFFDRRNTILGCAVGQAEHRHGHIVWTAPDRQRFVLPEEVAVAIRRRLPDMHRYGPDLPAFSHFAHVPIRKGDPDGARAAVHATLQRERPWSRFVAALRTLIPNEPH